MRADDHDLEKYLFAFTPRAVRPLELPHTAGNAWLGRVAAAALALFSILGGIWYALHENKNREAVVNSRAFPVDTQRPNQFFLTRLALDDPRKFEAHLDAESRHILPSFQDEQTTLHVFAKE